MKRVLLLVAMFLFFYGNLYGKDEINSNTNAFRKVECSQNNKYKLCFFIEKTKKKSNNLKVAIYSPRKAVIGLRFRIKIGERNISDEIKITNTIFRGELQILNIKLSEKISVPLPRKVTDLFSDKPPKRLTVEIISASYK